MKMTGVLPALVTPFDSDGKVDFKAFEALLNHLRSAGVKGWVPCGSTGEYNAMTAEERLDVIKFVKDFANEDELVVAGTNGGSTREVIEHTRRAREAGVDTVLLSAPYYATPTQEELVQHYLAVLDAVDVNIVLYHYPVKSMIISLDVLDALADHDRVVAIKDSSGELQRAVEIYDRYDGKIDLCSGSDDIALDFMIWGAKSWICGPANCLGRGCVDLVNTYESGDLDSARRQMLALYKAMAQLEAGKFVQKVKYGCELIGVPVGECRGPLQPLSDAEKADFARAMAPFIN